MTDAQREFIYRSWQTRGMILSLASMAERNLDGVLSRYFSVSENHQRELIELIFATDRISLKSKCKLLIEILRRKLGDKLSEHFPIIQKKLDDFSQIRNEFAHESDIPDGLNLPDEYYNSFQIVILKLRDISKTKGYTSVDIDGFYSKIMEVADILNRAEKILFKDGQVPPDDKSGKESQNLY